MSNNNNDDYEYLYKNIKRYLKTNRHDWFKFHKKFDHQGKQGTTGIIKVKNKKCVYKTSQTFNYIIKHEYSIMKSLKEIEKCCPYFALPYGLYNHNSDYDYKYKENLFDVERPKYVKNQTLLMEYIDSDDFTEFIEDYDTDDNIIYSIIKQILCALCISQRLKDFCHYDLHSSNILMTDCNPDLVVLYILNEKNSIVVPTLGKMPKIIDFGFSYTKDLNNKHFNSTLAHSNAGFLSCTKDFISDLKLFLVTVSHDTNQYHRSVKSQTFRNIIRNIFKPLDINWEAGWNNYSRDGASDELLNKINNLYSKSNLFKKYDYHCIDILQSLVKLPLRENSFINLEISFSTFINEFIKIEEHISSNIMNLYIFKNLVEIVSDLKSLYIKNPKECISQFKHKFLKFIDSIISYFNSRKIDFEKLLCSLLVFSECAEGFLFHQINHTTSQNKKYYKKMPLKTPSQIFACIESNIPHTYSFNPNTQVLVLDSVHNEQHHIPILPPLVQNLLNTTNHLSHGSILFDFITNKLDNDISEYNSTPQPNIESFNVEPSPQPSPQPKIDSFTVEPKSDKPFPDITITLDNINDIINNSDFESTIENTINKVFNKQFNTKKIKIEEEEVKEEEVKEEEVKEEEVKEEEVKEEEVKEEEVKEEEPVKKKRGRPKKVVDETKPEPVKKKRGRPKKVVDETKPEPVKKKRGRPKKVVE